MKPSKGNIFLCWDHLEAIGLDHLMLGIQPIYGDCSVCSKKSVGVIQIEKGRYDAMLVADPKNELNDVAFTSGVGNEAQQAAIEKRRKARSTQAVKARKSK